MKFANLLLAHITRKKKIKAVHTELNAAFMSLQAVMRADDEETRQRIASQAMIHIGEVKRGMVELGLEYQG